MSWNFLPFSALLALSGVYLVGRALGASGTQPEETQVPVEPAKTTGERAWRDAPLQTFMWQVQAARHSEPPFSR